jgi:predicted XRE-type DNA-binding protein
MANLQDAQETYSMGSSFDDFLEEEGLLAEVEATAIKRVLAYQFEQAMKNANISKAEMAKRMHTSQASVEKLINPDSKAITLNTLTKAAATLGMHLKMTLETCTLEQTAK